MRTIISGPVTDEDLDMAELLGGITPSSFVTNGTWTPPLSVHPVDVYPLCPKLSILAEDARDYTLCQNADAAIIANDNPHLLRVAEQYGLVVYRP